MLDFSDENATARFSDQLLGISISALLSNTGSFHVLISPGSHGELFRLEGKGYKFILWVNEGTVYFKRNQYLATRPISFPDRHYHINVSWKFDVFQLAVWSNDEVGKKDVCETVATPGNIHVPNGLVTWARQKHKLPQHSFGSVPEVLSVLIEAKMQIEQRIRDSNMFSLFWDYDRNSKSQNLPKPKREPQSFGGFLGLLQDDSVLKGYEVVPEGNASSGSVDAHVIASLTEGGQAKIAIEAKNAHSPDLEHGLTDQLPEYMRAIDADHGIYFALLYKCKSFDFPKDPRSDLGIRLMKMQPLENMTTNFIDLSFPLTPSKRGFTYK